MTCFSGYYHIVNKQITKSAQGAITGLAKLKCQGKAVLIYVRSLDDSHSARQCQKKALPNNTSL